MPIRYLKTRAALSGHVAVEDAETLAQWLSNQRRPAVTLRNCEHVHAAVLQVLLAMRPAITAWPRDERLARVLAAHRTTT